MILDGKGLADTIISELAEKAGNWHPSLLIVSVGDNPASEIYINNKIKAAERCGICVDVLKFSADVRDVEYKERIHREIILENPDGVIIQMPVPEHLSMVTSIIINSLSMRTDVDGFGSRNKALWDCSRGQKPCTAKGIMFMLQEYGIDLDGKDVCIINRSELVGKPLAAMMTARNATVTVCHSHTVNIAKYTRSADIVVVAVGKLDFLTADMIKTGAVVIDVGINKVGRRTVGDCSPDIVDKAGAYTPVPGGVGPMTVAMLMNNVWVSYWEGRKYE